MQQPTVVNALIWTRKSRKCSAVALQAQSRCSANPVERC